MDDRENPPNRDHESWCALPSREEVLRLGVPAFSRPARRSTPVEFWVNVYWGIVISGGVFGSGLMIVIFVLEGSHARSLADACFMFITAVFGGFMLGWLIAMLFAIPIVLTIATLCWAAWQDRFRMLWAMAAGAATGFAPVALFGQFWFAIVPALFGAAGALWLGGLHERRCGRPVWPRWGRIADWQFTLRDLFLRMTVLAMLITVWTMLVKAVMRWG